MPLKVKNVAAGWYDSHGTFHPIRASGDYDPNRLTEKEPYKYKKATKKQIREKAERAEAKAKEARKKRYERLKAERAAAKAAPKKKAAKKAAKKAVAAAKKAKKKNPIPVSRWVPAKVRRTKSGDIKVMLPLK
jgi:adenylate kinase